MHLYKLNSKDEDQTFLEYKPVRCNAIMNSVDSEKLRVGDNIVIQLSNNRKYMGMIKGMHFEISGSVANGMITIVRK
jgi:hypothetical protein